MTCLLAAATLAGCAGAAADRPAPAAEAAPPAPSPALQDTPASLAADALPSAPPAPAPAAAKEAATPKDAAAATIQPRMGAVLPFAFIYPRPAIEGLPLGYIHYGTSVPLLSDRPIDGPGCSRGFYPVAPRGYACLDRKTTIDLNDPYWKALNRIAPDPDAVWPFHYAFSNGAPMYSRIPTPEEQEKAERSLGPRGSHEALAEWSKGHEELISTEPIAPTAPTPSDVFEGNRRIAGSTHRNPVTLVWRVIPNGSMLSYTEAFEAEGRTWLLTNDLMIVPADRVRAIKRSNFKGIDLDKGIELPLAWNRTHSPKPKYRRGDDGAFVEAGTLPGKTPVAIKDDRVLSGKKVYFELRDEPGVFVDEAEMTFTRARTDLPRGVTPGSKWIEVKLLPGTLTAYEGTRPVFATLFSPGKGGVPVPGFDHTRYATTSLGFFPIEWKDLYATMSNEKYGEPKVLWFSDVPHIQYLKAPLALHVAYWHEDFGNPKSAECVNVSALDGHFLFHWTDPALPEGWSGVRPGGGNGTSTPVIISAR